VSISTVNNVNGRVDLFPFHHRQCGREVVSHPRGEIARISLKNSSSVLTHTGKGEGQPVRRLEGR
jgi:hypothetical protein